MSPIRGDLFREFLGKISRKSEPEIYKDIAELQDSTQKIGEKNTDQIQALPAPRQIDASWGANTYKHGGLMATIEHIFYRHGPDAGFSNTSKFSADVSLRDVSNYVDKALRYGKVTPNGPGGYEIEYNVGKVIGKDASGSPTSTLKVYVRDGVINTAFPK